MNLYLFHLNLISHKGRYIQWSPRKGFGNFRAAVCVQSDKWILYLVSLVFNYQLILLKRILSTTHCTFELAFTVSSPSADFHPPQLKKSQMLILEFICFSGNRF